VRGGRSRKNEPYLESGVWSHGRLSARVGRQGSELRPAEFLNISAAVVALWLKTLFPDFVKSTAVQIIAHLTAAMGPCCSIFRI
jgi:hypothetical protein